MSALARIRIPGTTSFRQIFAIARVTFNEILREKILWSSFVFGILCMGLAFAASQLSFADNARIALDFGMTAVSLVGGLMAVVMGAALIAKEVQNRTLYLVLTKAIWRWQFVAGKFLGLLGVLALNSAVMMAVVVAIFLASGGKADWALLKNFLLQMTELGVLAAVASVFSSLSTTTLSAIFTSGIWVTGHAMLDLRLFADRSETPWLGEVFRWLIRILPDLTRFDVKAQVSHALPITWTYTGVTLAYGAAYILFALVAACLIFSRRDL